MFHDQADTFSRPLADRTMTPTKAECIAKLKAAQARMRSNAKPNDQARKIAELEAIIGELKNKLADTESSVRKKDAEIDRLTRQKTPPTPAPVASCCPQCGETLTKPPPSKLPVPFFINAVAWAHGMRPEDLMSTSRRRTITNARKHLVHLLTRERTDLSTPMIGRLIYSGFGGLNYSSILHARDTFEKVAPLIRAQIAAVEATLAEAGK